MIRNRGDKVCNNASQKGMFEYTMIESTIGEPFAATDIPAFQTRASEFAHI
jgi:hypothetical protein